MSVVQLASVQQSERCAAVLYTTGPCYLRRLPVGRVDVWTSGRLDTNARCCSYASTGSSSATILCIRAISSSVVCRLSFSKWTLDSNSWMRSWMRRRASALVTDGPAVVSVGRGGAAFNGGRTIIGGAAFSGGGALTVLAAPVCRGGANPTGAAFTGGSGDGGEGGSPAAG